MYFLAVFGDDSEHDLGAGRFLLMLLIATGLGAVFHMIGDPRSSIPCIGASGGISAVVAYYGLRFPRSRLGVWVWWHLWLWLPAWVMLVLWLALQAVGALLQVNELSNVSALAHLGGATVGLIFWIIKQGGGRTPMAERAYRR